MSSKTWRISGWIAFSVVVLMLFSWIGLPLIIRYKINSNLAKMKDGYAGHVEDVSIAWLDARMSAHRLRIERPGREVGAPFMHVKEVQMEVLWREASKPRLGLSFDEPVLNFIDAPGEANDQKGPGFTLAEFRKQLPLDLGALTIKDLEIHFRNFHAQPPVDAYVQHVDVTADPLDRCIQEPPVGCDAEARLSGRLMRDGKLVANAHFEYDKAFALGASASLRGLTLKDLNPLLLKYADVDVQEGSLRVDTRIRMDNSNYRVVVEPSLKDAKIMGGDKHQTKAGREMGLALAAKFLERRGEDLAIVLKGGPRKDLDWEINRREEKGADSREGAQAAPAERAHASVEQPQ